MNNLLINWEVVTGLVLRYSYLYRRSLPRILDMVFWPCRDLLVWGYVTRYISNIDTLAGGSVTFLIGAMIFWDLLNRSAMGVTVSFLEDLWSRNFINIFVAPVRLRELITATFLVGLIKTVIILALLSLLSLTLYHYNLAVMGMVLIPFFGNLLVMGWAIGIFIVGLILRFGQSVEMMAWGIPFLIQPFSAVFYPVSVLPLWMQKVAWCLPSTPIFEGMRAVLKGSGTPWNLLFLSTGLNLLWFLAASIFLSQMYRVARHRGYLAKLGTQ